MLLDTLRAWRTPQQHYGVSALVLNVVIATRTHAHGHVSTHVRWLYNLIRVAAPPPCLMVSFWGHQQEPSRQSQSGLVVSCLLALGDLVLSQRGTSEHTVKQARLSSCCIGRVGGPSSKVFSDWFPERMVLEVKPGRVGSPTKPLACKSCSHRACTCRAPRKTWLMHRSLFLATYFADLDNLERVHEPGQLSTVLLELSERKAQKLLPAACTGMTAAGRSPHM